MIKKYIFILSLTLFSVVGLKACAIKPAMILSTDTFEYENHPSRNKGMLILTANHGDRGSALMLAERYEFGRHGFPVNLEQARVYYQIAARDEGIEAVTARHINPKTGEHNRTVRAKLALERVELKISGNWP